jgi:hypothetical protein
MKYGLFTLLVCCLCTTALMGQRTPSLDKFDIFHFDSKVHIELIISQGNTCDGIRYYRSTDGVDYKMIGQVTGICGSPDFPVSYEFTDEQPRVNATNYYKVEFGGFGFSEPVEIQIFDLSSAGSRAVPNPASESTTVHFENRNRDDYRLQLFDLNGRELRSLSGSDNFFEIDLRGLPNGMLLYRIFKSESPNQTIDGRILNQ